MARMRSHYGRDDRDGDKLMTMGGISKGRAGFLQHWGRHTSEHINLQ